MSTLEPTLDRSDYLDDDVFALERENLWARQWVLVARDECLRGPGDRLVVDVLGTSIIVVRDHDGGLRGYHNVCRHRGAQLVDTVRAGALPACVSPSPSIRCPYHSWTYGLDGRLKHAPFLDRAETAELHDLSLHPVHVDTWGGFLFVHLGAEPDGTLAAQIGDVAERVVRYPLADLRVGLTLTYDVAANWKVIAENYNECYHCGPVHPELCELVPDFRRGGAGLEWPDGIPHRPGAWTFTGSGTTNRTPFPTLDKSERVRHKGELVYPNLLLSLSADHVAAFRVEPRSAHVTRVVCELLFHADAMEAPDFDPTDSGDFWDMVNRQDWSICESVQRGMASPAWTGGWMAPMEDDSLNIVRWYRDMMRRPA